MEPEEEKLRRSMREAENTMRIAMKDWQNARVCHQTYQKELDNLLHNSRGGHENTFKSVTQQIDLGKKKLRRLETCLDSGNDGVYDYIKELEVVFNDLQRLAESWNKTS